jgi:hypothetical protein
LLLNHTQPRRQTGLLADSLKFGARSYAGGDPPLQDHAAVSLDRLNRDRECAVVLGSFTE